MLSATLLKASEEKINQASFLGLSILNSDLIKVRTQLWSIGGFTQARSTKQKRAIDKFFTNYQLKDSYYIEFRYLSDGKLLSAKRQYRPQSIHFNNRHDAIKTLEVAEELSKSLGDPTNVLTKSWAGLPSYQAYIWETDLIKITLDRQGNDKLGNIFVLYQVKTDPYFIALAE